MRLGYTSSTAGNQPITMRPELGRVKAPAGVPQRAVFFGTGRYLGFSDLVPGAPSQSIAQAIYAVKDTGADLGLLTARRANLVAQTLQQRHQPAHDGRRRRRQLGDRRTAGTSTTPVGERMTIDPTLQLSTLAIASNAPDTNYCTVGGTSWLYALNYSTGGRGGPPQVEHRCGHQTDRRTFTGNALAVGVSVVQLPDGKVVAIVTASDTK